MIKAVIFDMDGLLIDSEPMWRRAQAYAFGTVGLQLSEDDMKHTMGRRIDEVVAFWHHERPWQGASLKDIEALIVDKVIELVKSEGTALPGVSYILDFFTQKSLTMAVASSSYPEIIDAVIDTLHIRNYFEHLYSAQNEAYGKPHPGVYIKVAELCGVRPEYCLAFEDSPSGVLAAKAAKMTCVAVPTPENRHNKIIQIADEVINSLQDFDERLLNLGSPR